MSRNERDGASSSASGEGRTGASDDGVAVGMRFGGRPRGRTIGHGENRARPRGRRHRRAGVPRRRARGPRAGGRLGPAHGGPDRRLVGRVGHRRRPPARRRRVRPGRAGRGRRACRRTGAAFFAAVDGADEDLPVPSAGDLLHGWRLPSPALRGAHRSGGRGRSARPPSPARCSRPVATTSASAPRCSTASGPAGPPASGSAPPGSDDGRRVVFGRPGAPYALACPRRWRRRAPSPATSRRCRSAAAVRRRRRALGHQRRRARATPASTS